MNLNKLYTYDAKIHAEKKQGDFFGRAPFEHKEEQFQPDERGENGN